MLNRFTSLRRLRRRLQSQRWAALALLYHRVTELPLDPQRLCVTPQHFGEHLDVLVEHSTLESLEFIDRFRRGRLPSRAVVVTFDDGYADNLSNAKPILERYGVPATVFVTTGDMGGDREFWWDELERLLLQPGVLPEVIRLKCNGSEHRWELGPAARYTSDDYVRYAGWNVLQHNTPTPRHELYRSLCTLVRPLAASERGRLMDELLAAAGTQPARRASHRVLSPQELVDLAEGGLVEVGAHTVSHAQLSALPIDQQREEIGQSKTQLERILARPVSTFAYPYGSRLDYTSQTVTAVRAAGFTAACSNFPEGLSRRTDRFQLPRLIVSDTDGNAFEQRLVDALNG